MFEARLGLVLLPKGKRRSALERAFDRVRTEDLSSRVLTLDRAAANVYADLAAERQRTGRFIAIPRTFKGLGVLIVDPWRTVRRPDR